jgi:hypothetical protein
VFPSEYLEELGSGFVEFVGDVVRGSLSFESGDEGSLAFFGPSVDSESELYFLFEVVDSFCGLLKGLKFGFLFGILFAHDRFVFFIFDSE